MSMRDQYENLDKYAAYDYKDVSNAYGHGEDDAIDKVLEIIDRLNDTKALADKTPLGHHIHKTLANEIKQAVLALKGVEG